jgi:membrane protease YdiL (CAAX protease family)
MPTDIRPPAFLAHHKSVKVSAFTVREKLWLLAAAVLVPVAIFFQQFALDLRSQTLSGAPAEVKAIEEVYDPGVSDFTVSSKLAVKVRALQRQDDEEPEEPVSAVMASLEQLAVTRAERVRLAVVAAELVGAEDALRRLKIVEAEVTPRGDLAMDIAWFKGIYGGKRAEVTPEVERGLVERHGWFAQIALTHGLPNHDNDRYRAISVGKLAALFAGSGLVGVGMLIGGIVVVVLTIVKWNDGDFEMRLEEAAGGPVYLELFTLFVGGFSLLVSANLVMFGLSVEGTSAAFVIEEVLLWTLVAVLAWPLFRKIPWARFAWDVGLHRGQGVLRELRAGFCGWLASTPIMLALSLLIGLFVSGGDEEPSGYPLFESPRGNSWAIVVVSMLSAVVWAPLVEEIVFRGALQRYLRPRLKWWGAVLVTALIFGLIHPYTPAGLIQVGVSGVLFGFLREWRGSLIAPITAHFLHNGTIMAFTVGMLMALE